MKKLVLYIANLLGLSSERKVEHTYTNKVTEVLAFIQAHQSEGYKLKKGESTDVNGKGALINAWAYAMTSWQDIEGVRFVRTPKPVKVEKVDNPEVKKMMVMSDLLNDKCHTFNNLIILN